MRYEKGDTSDGLLIQGIIRQIKKKEKKKTNTENGGMQDRWTGLMPDDEVKKGVN